MGIHPFQVSDLNANLFETTLNRVGAGTASEFAIVPDNINANSSRYLRLMAQWSNASVNGNIITSPQANSYGQSTGQNNGTSNAQPWRPNGGYFMRGLYFTGTFIPPNSNGFRNGYVGCFISGQIDPAYAHDSNNTGVVDYEPIYGHGQAVFPMTADIPHQWLDSNSSPSDGTDQILNNSSAYSRTAYMPASYMIFHIDSTGSNTLGSGAVQFHFENRPSLRMAGFTDNNGQSGIVPSWAGTCTPHSGFGAPYPYPSDPLRNEGGLTSSATDNYHEYYQVSGVRKLNSRGLSFHVAKVFDNGYGAMSYPYEEDGLTLGAGVIVSGGGSIQQPYPQVNNQSEYTWAGGRDVGASIISTSVTSNVVTVNCNNTFTAGQIVLIQGLPNATWLNGQLLTIVSTIGSGPVFTAFTANFTHSNYTTLAETLGTATFNPDFRVHQGATFIINEEYYGFVADTKCTIWSNKASMVPLLFFDLADTWTASVAKRIAGVAVVPLYINATGAQSWQVFFLSEDGFLAIYDFTQTNGVLALGTQAPAVAAAGEAYGALRARSTTSTITNIAITSNVLTVTCTNTFEAGEIVNLQGLTTATFLNNQTVTVVTPGGSSFTAAYTHANYTSAADTGTAVGYSLWALYGTMTADPRTTQTGLTNTANINLYRYLIGTGVWGSKITSPNTGRHNGRSLSEMIVARDSRLYMLIEDVTSTAGFIVANTFGSVQGVNWQVMAYDPVAATWNATKINGGATPIQYGIAGTVNTSSNTVTWVSGDLFPTQGQTGQPIIINGVLYAVSSFNSTTSLTLTTVAGTQTGVSYNYTNTGANNSTPNDRDDFWYYNINAFLHDINPNLLLIQPNWTGGTFSTLTISGTTAALSNANLSIVAPATLWTGDSFIPSQSTPATDPVSVIHARDFATNGERSIFFLHQLNNVTAGQPPVYLAPPSYSWAAPTALALIQMNATTGNPAGVASFQKDFWFVGDLAGGGNFEDRWAWTYPVQMTDNYAHFVRIYGGGMDGLPTNTVYGRAALQGIGYMPTYWKWTGSAWVMADNWNDAFTHPYTIPAANVAVPLPYGLNVTFGPLSSTSWTGGEFHTFNLCWGNTKFARNMRESWAQFAGQTFTNLETRTVSSQDALSMNLIDTDPGTATWTAPTSATPNTAALTTSYLGWSTAAAWNMLDSSHAPFDATPTQLVWTPSTFAPGTQIIPSAQAVTGSNPYSWTVGSFTYVSSSSGESGGQQSWQAFSGCPDNSWTANGGSGTPWFLTIDLGSGNSQTALSYGFRPMWQQGDVSTEFVPTAWQLQGSTTGAFAGEQVVVDTRSAVTPSRGYAFTCNGTTGAFRYYRLFITTVTGAWPSVSMFRLSTAVLQTTCDFVDLVFFSYGSTPSNATYLYRWNRQWNMLRGLTIEVSTNNGGTYTTIMEPGGTVSGGTAPLWRAHNGFAFSFPRQTGITNIRVTNQHGYNVNSTQTAFGPFYLIDYGVSQTVLNSARLGTNGTQGTPTQASFDFNSLGIATDVPNISIDGANPSLFSAINILEDSAVIGFWDFNPVGSFQYKLHPFFGFVFFQGAGPDGSSGGDMFPAVGTSMSIFYQWGRRI